MVGNSEIVCMYKGWYWKKKKSDSKDKKISEAGKILDSCSPTKNGGQGPWNGVGSAHFIICFLYYK